MACLLPCALYFIVDPGVLPRKEAVVLCRSSGPAVPPAKPAPADSPTIVSSSHPAGMTSSPPSSGAGWGTSGAEQTGDVTSELPLLHGRHCPPPPPPWERDVRRKSRRDEPPPRCLAQGRAATPLPAAWTSPFSPLPNVPPRPARESATTPAPPAHPAAQPSTIGAIQRNPTQEYSAISKSTQHSIPGAAAQPKALNCADGPRTAEKSRAGRVASRARWSRVTQRSPELAINIGMPL